MEISKRLEAIASLVDADAKVFDVGCDHGLLSIYLASNDHEVVASDITTFCIEKTLENVSKSKIENIEVIRTDGLKGLPIKKRDNIVIAGMGTYTILNILRDSQKKLSNTLIIQSNNNHDILRREVCKLGYYIDQEKIVKDKKLYLIIKFKKGCRNYRDIDYILGLNNNIEYKKKVLKRYIDMYNSIPCKYFIRKIQTKILIKKIKGEL